MPLFPPNRKNQVYSLPFNSKDSIMPLFPPNNQVYSPPFNSKDSIMPFFPPNRKNQVYSLPFTGKDNMLNGRGMGEADELFF